MEFNVSSFYDGEESGKQLNSTALEQDENEQKEWKLSPITAEERRVKTSIFQRSSHLQSSNFKSPLRAVNSTDPSTSGYDSKNTTACTPQQSSSSDPKLSMSAELSSFVANNSPNPFDSILLNSLHKSINFSPRLILSSQESGSQQKGGERFQWSVEQLAILKPAHISEDEIAASYRSPIPEIEEKIQEALNEYWSNNVSYIPSPDGPRFVNLTHRDGTVTTIRYGEEAASSEGNTPSLANIVRRKEAVKAAYATSSPKQRPRKNLRQVRNRVCQTELTIPPGLDLDLKKLLGENFVYQDQEAEDEEVFNISVCSNFSTRRRLFSNGGGQQEDGAEDVANSSIISTDDLLMNESSAQPFNDSLSPVRRSVDVTEDIEDTTDNLDQENASTSATRSHASQIAINISILNDCMMNSIDEAENEEIDEEKLEETDERSEEIRRNIFSDSHLRE
ncbi:CRE-SPAT-1 protein [Caenorhabditis remanei]|uniref:Protein aurora borealis n=1 Tax=Caenorhabditis remanei TaxID=31234 RepID=E3LRJ7_CAERE|nr:CRE-SPAT-1 protein [Caenorhabditis remanei]